MRTPTRDALHRVPVIRDARKSCALLGFALLSLKAKNAQRVFLFLETLANPVHCSDLLALEVSLEMAYTP